MKTVYTLKERKDSGELHLFEGEMENDDQCTSNAWSLCSSMDKTESNGNKFACLTEDEARKECAEIGRDVCGNCIKTLYATYN